MKPALNQTCYIVSATKNIYGDIVNTGSANVRINCKVRDIGSVDNSASNREEKTSDAMIWVDDNSSIVLGAVLYYDSVYYRIMDIIKARTLSSNAIQFLKLKVERIKSVASVS